MENSLTAVRNNTLIELSFSSNFIYSSNPKEGFVNASTENPASVKAVFNVKTTSCSSSTTKILLVRPDFGTTTLRISSLNEQSPSAVVVVCNPSSELN